VKKIGCFTLLLALLSSCLHDYEMAVYTINSFELLPATTATFNGKPAYYSNTIDKDLFALELNFQISSNLNDIDYDPNESTSETTNPIDSVRVWSNSTFSGKPAGTALNACFYVLTETYNNAYRLNSNAFLSLSNSQKEEAFYSKIHFVCDSEPTAGNYKFYTQLFFRDGTSMIDSTQQITLE